MAMTTWTESYRGVAYPWHCDSMGHMNTQFYAAMYDSATFHFLSRLAHYNELEQRKLGWADVRQLIEYKHEVRSGALIVVRTVLKRIGNNSVECLHEMRNAETDMPHSTSENTVVLFDLARRAAVPLDDEIRRRGAAFLE
jgi:acyl-CoA thioester hydrolase